MTRNNSADDTFDIDGFDELKNQYRAISDEMPDSAIDKQIIAAAHRELANPQPRRQLKISWWRRLVLPLYVAATFTFTAIAAHWFWPGNEQAARTLPGTAPATVNFEVARPQAKQELQRASQRQKRTLPQPEMLMAPPELSKSETASAAKVVEQSADLSIQEETQFDDGTPLGADEEKVTITGSRTSNQGAQHAAELSHPEKEKWARKIIQLFREGKVQEARQELVRFKQLYPDYPIDEQLKPFQR